MEHVLALHIVLKLLYNLYILMDKGDYVTIPVL